MKEPFLLVFLGTTDCTHVLDSLWDSNSLLDTGMHVCTLQDLSENSLTEISPLNHLPQLLTLKAEHNLITSADLNEVRDCLFRCKKKSTLLCCSYFGVRIG